MSAPKNNKNAFKHGFYSKHFTKTENRELQKTRLDLLDEIGLLRVYLARISATLSNKRSLSEDDLKMLNTATLITTSVATLMRSQSFLGGSSEGVEKAIEDAILSQRDQWILA
jgi:hypothetical protein